jgi:hypothetical protein
MMTQAGFKVPELQSLIWIMERAAMGLDQHQVKGFR